MQTNRSSSNLPLNLCMLLTVNLFGVGSLLDNRPDPAIHLKHRCCAVCHVPHGRRVQGQRAIFDLAHSNLRSGQELEDR